MMKSLSKDFQVNSDVAFTTGLFSLIDAIMDQPMSTILNALSLSKDITSALIAGEGSLGELLTTVILYERGRWEELEHSQDGSDEFGTHYLEAVNWANSLIRTV